MFEESNRGLKISVIKICRIIAQKLLLLCYEKDVNRRIAKKGKCSTVHQVLNSGTQNCANNKEF